MRSAASLPWGFVAAALAAFDVRTGLCALRRGQKQIPEFGYDAPEPSSPFAVHKADREGLQPGVNKMSLSPLMNLFPGPEPMSFIVPNFAAGQGVCDNLVPMRQPGPRVCKGDISITNDLREVAKMEPLECLKDKLNGPGGVFARACMMCNLPQLDNMVWASTTRTGHACNDRYKVLNRFAVATLWGDKRVVDQLRRATYFIERGMKQFKTVDEALASLGQRILKGCEQFADTDDDRVISRAEQKAYLQAVFIIANVAPEVAVLGNVGANDLREWTTLYMNQWVEWAPGWSPYNTSRTGAGSLPTIGMPVGRPPQAMQAAPPGQPPGAPQAMQAAPPVQEPPVQWDYGFDPGLTKKTAMGRLYPDMPGLTIIGQQAPYVPGQQMPYVPGQQMPYMPAQTGQPAAYMPAQTNTGASPPPMYKLAMPKSGFQSWLDSWLGKWLAWRPRLNFPSFPKPGDPIPAPPGGWPAPTLPPQTMPQRAPSSGPLAADGSWSVDASLAYPAYR